MEAHEEPMYDPDELYGAIDDMDADLLIYGGVGGVVKTVLSATGKGLATAGKATGRGLLAVGKGTGKVLGKVGTGVAKGTAAIVQSSPERMERRQTRRAGRRDGGDGLLASMWQGREGREDRDGVLASWIGGREERRERREERRERRAQGGGLLESLLGGRGEGRVSGPVAVPAPVMAPVPKGAYVPVAAPIPTVTTAPAPGAWTEAMLPASYKMALSEIQSLVNLGKMKKAKRAARKLGNEVKRDVRRSKFAWLHAFGDSVDAFASGVAPTIAPAAYGRVGASAASVMYSHRYSGW